MPRYLILVVYLFLCFSILISAYVFTFIIPSIVFYTKMSDQFGDHVYLGFILILLISLIFAGLFARWIARWINSKKRNKGNKAFLILLTLATASIIYYWIGSLTPKPFVPLISYDKRFVAGNFPNKEDIVELKAQGFNHIITLLDPLNFPVEPFLLYKEIKDAKAAGINLIQLPMYPRYMDKKTTKEIKMLINTSKNEKYYVHAYNDLDRIIKFMDVLDQSTFQKLKNENPLTQIENKTYNFEKGIAIQASKNLIVSPQPTDKDLEKYILSTNQLIKNPIKTIIAINTDISSHQENLFKQHGIKFYTYKIDIFPYDPTKLLNIAEFIKQQKPQVLLFSYLGPPASIINTGILLSYLTNLPAFPINIIKNLQLSNGPIEVVAPNIALGSAPNSSELKILQDHGAKGFIYIGSCKAQDDLVIKNIKASESSFFCFSAAEYSKILNVVNQNGPWYLFGPELNTIRKKLIYNKKDLIPDYLNVVSNLNNTL